MIETVTVLPEYGVDLWSAAALPVGVALDLLLGITSRKPGPSAAIGRLVGLAEKGLRGSVARQGGGSKPELFAGCVLAVLVVGLVGGMAWFASEVFNQVGGPACLVGRSLLIALGLGFGRFGAEAVRASKAVDPTSARREAASLVGLEGARLDPSSLRVACVRALGEQANRRAIAPFFWLAILGPAGLWSYQAIDTLKGKVVDAGPRSRFFGFASARLDDVANWLPARLTWLLLVLSAALLGHDAGSAWRTGLAEGRNHPERSGAWGRGTLSAALGLQPGGRAATGPVEGSTVRTSLWIVRVAGLHAAALALAYRIIVMGG
jgi:adenosylcobinamide-phosphate synthase